MVVVMHLLCDNRIAEWVKEIWDEVRVHPWWRREGEVEDGKRTASSASQNNSQLKQWQL